MPTSGGYRNMYGRQAGSMHPNGMLSCEFMLTVKIPYEHYSCVLKDWSC